jgi:hypothetical protein
MSASEHLNNYLFDEMYKRVHGLSIEQTLQGYARLFSTSPRIFTPEEHKEIHEAFRKRTKKEKSWEDMQNAIAQPTDTRQTIKDFQWGRHLIGWPTPVARQLRDLTKLVRGYARKNDVVLYRGAFRTPAEDIGPGKTTPLSATNDRYVARSFASGSYDAIMGGGVRPPGPKKVGRIYKFKEGTVRGIPLIEFGGVPRTVGRGYRKESEWLILPESIEEE